MLNKMIGASIVGAVCALAALPAVAGAQGEAPAAPPSPAALTTAPGRATFRSRRARSR